MDIVLSAFRTTESGHYCSHYVETKYTSSRKKKEGNTELPIYLF